VRLGTVAYVRRGGLITGAALLVCAFFATASAQAITYAPVDKAGPPLSVPQSTLDASLECNGTLAGHTPVLLVPGTGSNPHSNFSWNWEPALEKLGIPWCGVTLPKNALGDIQVAGEYVVNAIRAMHTAAGGKISIIGHSQGGMLPRWALRFWPDTRALVDDQIGFAPSNHGTTGAEFLCSISCAAADWQQSDRSEFIKALNSYQETFPGISYTEVYTHTDEVVTPNSDDSGSSSLHGGRGEITNEAIQQICPLDLDEHLAIGTQDNVAYALAVDALSHPGPANPAAIPSSVCSQPLMPGINPATYLLDSGSAGADLLANTLAAPAVKSEPPLRCYVTASCPESAKGEGASAGRKRKCRHKRRRGHKAEASKRHHCKKHKRRR
jgi:triacylglycerol esterase/lipase EstA (alpha/beta hydrolase family)